MTANVTMFAPTGSGGSIQTDNSGVVFVKSDGTVSVSPLDVNTLAKLGFKIAAVTHRVYTTPCPPGVASATVTVASVSVSAGSTTLTIAAQPIVPRQLQAVIDPGTLAITAGNLVLTYTGNDGQTHVDTLSLVTAVSTLVTVATSFGVEHLTSAIISGLVGGVGWLRGIGTNTALALPLDSQFASLSVTKETLISTAQTTAVSSGVDETVGSITSSNGLIIPTTVPNVSQNLSFGFNFYTPA